MGTRHGVRTRAGQYAWTPVQVPAWKCLCQREERFTCASGMACVYLKDRVGSRGRCMCARCVVRVAPGTVYLHARGGVRGREESYYGEWSTFTWEEVYERTRGEMRGRGRRRTSARAAGSMRTECSGGSVFGWFASAWGVDSRLILSIGVAIVSTSL